MSASRSRLRRSASVETETASSPSISSLSLATAAISTLFLITALAGVWAAYDREAAWQRFALLAAGLLVMLVMAAFAWRRGTPALALMGLGCALLAGAIGGFFLLVYDWAASGTSKVDFLHQVGLWLQEARPVISVPEDINANVAGSALTVLLPLGFAGVVWAWRTGARDNKLWLFIALGGALSLLIGMSALILSASRGAWLGLLAGAVAVIWLALRRRLSEATGKRHLLDGLALTVLLVGLTGYWLAFQQAELAQFLGSVTVGESAVTRPVLWQDALALIGDYPITGSGLDSTMMVYSTYGRLLHVGYITHMHNLFLQIAVEQGIPALIIFLGLLLIAGWSLLRACGRQQTGVAVFCFAAVASLTALVVHGLVDAGLYMSLLSPLTFAPPGFAIAVAVASSIKARAPKSRNSLSLSFLALASILAVLLGLALLTSRGQAIFQANLGAVLQTRAELGVYRWPEWPIQDALRRSPGVDLGPAVTRYRAALARDPGQTAANRRLGQIELSWGQYDSAREHLEVAYASAPWQRSTRQLLGESYAVGREVGKAADLWRNLGADKSQLGIRAWWYDHIGEPQRAQWLRQAAELAQDRDHIE